MIHNKCLQYLQYWMPVGRLFLCTVFCRFLCKLAWFRKEMWNHGPAGRLKCRRSSMRTRSCRCLFRSRCRCLMCRLSRRLWKSLKSSSLPNIWCFEFFLGCIFESTSWFSWKHGKYCGRAGRFWRLLHILRYVDKVVPIPVAKQVHIPMVSTVTGRGLVVPSVRSLVPPMMTPISLKSHTERQTTQQTIFSPKKVLQCVTKM